MTINSKKRVTLFLNPSLLRHAKAQAAVEEMSLAALIERDLIKYLPKETAFENDEIYKDRIKRKNPR